MTTVRAKQQPLVYSGQWIRNRLAAIRIGKWQTGKIDCGFKASAADCALLASREHHRIRSHISKANLPFNISHSFHLFIAGQLIGFGYVWRLQ
jgi:hypothetical protein